MDNKIPDKQRLFFALWPDDETRARLAGIGARLPGAQGRSVADENLHITLSFIGEVDDEKRQCLEQVAGKVTIDPFTVVLDKLGYFAKTRLVWLGVSTVPPELQALSKTLNKHLRPCGHKPDRRRLVPHVTLMRKAKPLGELFEFAPVEWHVNRFSLMRSMAVPDGVHYRQLREYVYEQ